MDANCPICGSSLSQSDRIPGWPEGLAGWELLHCPACRHCSCPAAFPVSLDYDNVYNQSYHDQQVEALRDSGRHHQFCLLPPYRAFFEQLGPGRGRRLLDIGCGAGRFLLAARGRDWQVRGTEPAGSAVETARSHGLDVDNTDPATFSPAGFDVLCLFDVLEHLSDPRALLNSVLHVLKPGGSLFITLPNWDCPLMQSTGRADWLPPVHLQFFSAQSLRKLLETCDASLQVLAIGEISTDPRPPLCSPWQDNGHSTLRWHSGELLRWLSRRLRGHRRHSAQLHVHARLR